MKIARLLAAAPAALGAAAAAGGLTYAARRARTVHPITVRHTTLDQLAGDASERGASRDCSCHSAQDAALSSGSTALSLQALPRQRNVLDGERQDNEARTHTLDPAPVDRLRDAAQELTGDAAQPAEQHSASGPGDSEGTSPALPHEDETSSVPPDKQNEQPGDAQHPANPEYVPGTPTREWTDARLEQLASGAVPLVDVRPGALGTLDLYVFANETTLCVIPGNQDVTDRLVESLNDDVPVSLLGGSSLAGAYALTFEVGAGTVYLLADQVIASL